MVSYIDVVTLVDVSQAVEVKTCKGRSKLTFLS